MTLKVPLIDVAELYSSLYINLYFISYSCGIDIVGQVPQSVFYPLCDQMNDRRLNG